MRSSCAAVLILSFSTASADTTTRVLVVPKDGDAFVGQLVKPTDSIGVNYVSNLADWKDPAKDVPAKTDDTDAPIPELVAIIFKTSPCPPAEKPMQMPPAQPESAGCADAPAAPPSWTPGVNVRDYKEKGDQIIVREKPFIFYGHVNCDVVFSIKVEAQDKTQETAFSKKFPRDKLSAIYFLGAPAASGQSKRGSGPDGESSTPYDTLVAQLAVLKYQARRLREEFAQANREVAGLNGLPALACPPGCPPLPGPDTAEAAIQTQRVDALWRAYQATAVQIDALQTALAFVPRPPPDPSTPPEPYEAFYRTPCVRPVPDCDDFTENDLVSKTAEKNPYGSLQQRIARTHSTPFDYRFEQPAQFPMPHFTFDGCRVDTEGVVVYEGMRFVATRDGQYEVSFTTSAPKTPVTLRLQLVFSCPEGCGFTLTLPPITLNPETKAFEGNYVGESYQVHHAGFSRMIAERFGELDAMTVARRGTARFGSWPEGIERFEELNPSTVTVQATQTTQFAPSVP